ncbi:MAG: lipoprotein [Caldimonas sp.]
MLRVVASVVVRRRVALALGACAATSVLLAGCGQKGPLVLVRPLAAASAASASAAPTAPASAPK